MKNIECQVSIIIGINFITLMEKCFLLIFTATILECVFITFCALHYGLRHRRFFHANTFLFSSLNRYKANMIWENNDYGLCFDGLWQRLETAETHVCICCLQTSSCPFVSQLSVCRSLYLYCVPVLPANLLSQPIKAWQAQDCSTGRAREYNVSTGST